jgi:hypothetical protein
MSRRRSRRPGSWLTRVLGVGLWDVAVELELGCWAREDLGHAIFPSPPCGPTRTWPLHPGRHRGPAEPWTERAGTQAVGRPARPGRGGSAGRRSRQWVHRRAVDAGANRASDRTADKGPTSSDIIRRTCGHRCTIGWAGACSVQSAAPPNATKRQSTAGSTSAGRRFCKRPTAQSLSGLLRRERAQPDPNVRRTWAPRGLPPTLTLPFNWKKASMAAALCDGVRGGGAHWPSTSWPATTTPTP